MSIFTHSTGAWRSVGWPVKGEPGGGLGARLGTKLGGSSGGIILGAMVLCPTGPDPGCTAGKATAADEVTDALEELDSTLAGSAYTTSSRASTRSACPRLLMTSTPLRSA